MRMTAGFPPIAWEMHGSDGPPVLLVMGFGMRGLVWKPQLDVLPLHHQVITYDHRGIGRSVRAGRLWSMPQLATDACRVMDAAGWASAHVVGVSMGGMVAQELALRHPERVRSLTLIVTHAGGGGAVPSPAGLRLLVAAMAGPRSGRADALARLLYPEDYLATVDRVTFRAALADRTAEPPSRRTLLGQLSAILRHDTRDRLGSLDRRTLVVRAGRDILIDPARSLELAGLIPGARLLDFPEAGHGVIHQCCDRLNDAILEHLAAT